MMKLTHKLSLFGLGLALSLVIGSSACAPAPAAPTAAPAKPAPAVAPVKQAEAQPAAKPAAKASADWEQEWQQILEAAKREGQVTLAAPPGADFRAGLTEGFQRKYGLTVDYQGLRGAEVIPRISSEREAGQYLWDVFVGGSSTAVRGLAPIKALDPLEPALVLPEVTDPKNWRDAGLKFIDGARHVLVMTSFQGGTIYINTNLVRPDEFKSHRDLLDPKWKERILLDDPRVSGPGQGVFTFFYLHPELGLDFIRALARQEPTLLRDFVQQLDALGQGRYPVLVGGQDPLADERMKQGVPITIVEPRQLREGTEVRGSPSYLSVFNRAPHPNAAKLYINWLLTQEGQTEFARNIGQISRRADVPTDHVSPWRLPLPGSINTEDVRGLDARMELHPYLEELFGKL